MTAAPSRAPQVTRRAEEALARTAIAVNPYLCALADGTMPIAVFRASQEQFAFAVSYFPRPMAALLARMPDPYERLDILHNLVEEHGDFDPRAFHHTTFRQFLRSIGASTIGLRPEAPVRAFNSVLGAACGLDDIAVGIACLGVIEHAFAGISARIGQAVVARGWVPADELVHYALHAEIDERHAEEFFAIIEPRWSDPQSRAAIEEGLDLGAYAFDRLYRDLATTADDVVVLRAVG